MKRCHIFAVFWLLASGPAFALSDKPYIEPADTDLIYVIPPAPAPHSLEQRRDLRTMHAAQNGRSEQASKRASEDAQVSIFRFADVLGPNFTAEKVPTVAAFFAKVGRDTTGQTNLLKDCWERPRPFVSDWDLHPLPGLADSVANRPGTKNTAPHDAASPCRVAEPTQTYSYSYPSGHSTFGAMTAILLSQMVPEMREQLYARGWEYGRNRVIAGVHYMSDVEAGRITATVLATRMLDSPEFRRDLNDARKELRAALGLP